MPLLVTSGTITLMPIEALKLGLGLKPSGSEEEKRPDNSRGMPASRPAEAPLLPGRKAVGLSARLGLAMKASPVLSSHAVGQAALGALLEGETAESQHPVEPEDVCGSAPIPSINGNASGVVGGSPLEPASGEREATEEQQGAASTRRSNSAQRRLPLFLGGGPF
jgi:hypothetical protein